MYDVSTHQNDMLQSKLISYNITISWSHEQYIPYNVGSECTTAVTTFPKLLKLPVSSFGRFKKKKKTLFYKFSTQDQFF